MAPDPPPDDVAQLVDAGSRGVEHQFRGADDRVQQLPFAVDRLAQAEPRRAQRVLAACLAVALQQDLVVCMQEDHFAAGIPRPQVPTTSGRCARSAARFLASMPMARLA